MTILGIDLSHWSELTRRPVNVVEQGYDFMFWKSTQGSTYVDPSFSHDSDRYGNPLFAAFHYMDNSNPDLQYENIARVVPVFVPVIIDMEQGNLATAQRLINRLRENGYSSPLFYLPEWYWVQLERPDISHMPPLWASMRVPGAGTGTELFHKVAITNWHSYGGNTPAVLQYTQNARIHGVNVDASVYAGSRNDLDYLLHRTTPVAPMPDPVHVYVVRAGDTLWDIAFMLYGDSALWHNIATANHLSNPNRLLPGQRLVIPGWDGIYHSITSTIRYTVKTGDTLTSIAARYHVSVNALYATNRTAIGDNPNHILVGMVLSIPKVS